VPIGAPGQRRTADLAQFLHSEIAAGRQGKDEASMAGKINPDSLSRDAVPMRRDVFSIDADLGCLDHNQRQNGFSGIPHS
jgi:hypothetical protein